MKNTIYIIFLLISNVNYSQDYRSPEYQKLRIDEAITCIKNNELERATMILYFVNNINSTNNLLCKSKGYRSGGTENRIRTTHHLKVAKGW
ncbi:hypothetical protein FLSI110296_16005 [Flavobacterium sinopsychrotolerans]|uniref:Uncharacterized protein n=1 Tax=Flavobacterium sinopsychrotolerans TaxID=604089 RepID=A0A1H8RQH1_9FLAO|nr:hypothetical protein SAMN04487942_0134 [Flavobacterium sinopsychrotolerans]